MKIVTPPPLITGLDYDYVEQTVRAIKSSANVLHTPMLPLEPGPLLSIHLQSNRPDNFPTFLENLEASVDDPSRIEVVVKIDDVDEPMNELLPKLVKKHSAMTVKYISTPLDGGFFELWRSMNDMLHVCHPNAYFLWNMNDEMSILNKGWDTALAKYVGLFPDHLFRLRTSLDRYRNYYDYWENGFAPETSAITTKKWIDTCGNWNPCLGPDSFNQCVAFYFGYHDRFNKRRPIRDVCIHDIMLAGEGAFLGMEGEALYRRARGASKAWYRLMSHKMQTDASRRSQRVAAAIWGHANVEGSFTIEDDTRRQKVLVRDAHRAVANSFSYKLSKIRVVLSNLYRATAYYNYGGGGSTIKMSRARQIGGFLALRFNFFNYFRTQLMRQRRFRGRAVRFGLRTTLKMRFLPVNWNLVEAARQKKLSMPHMVLSFTKRVAKGVGTKGFNKGMRFHSSVYEFDKVHSSIDWPSYIPLLSKVTWPHYLNEYRVQDVLVRCLLLQHWYRLSDKQFEIMLGRDLAFQRFIGVPLNDTLPTKAVIQEFRKLAREAGIEEEIYHLADRFVPREQLPADHLMPQDIPAKKLA